MIYTFKDFNKYVIWRNFMSNSINFTTPIEELRVHMASEGAIITETIHSTKATKPILSPIPQERV